jgi:Zn-finger nucleic acid-binding protein
MDLFAARGYFFCRYCGSFYFPETTADQGVRVLGQGSEALACPVCTKSLASAVLDGLHSVHYCQNCRGVLLPRGSFAEAVQKRRAWATGPPIAPARLERSELDRRLICPRCRVRMNTHPYYGPGNVVIDSCDRCDAIWLDFGELKQIESAPGSDRGTREIVPDSLPSPSIEPDSDDESEKKRGLDLLSVLELFLSR